MIENMRRVFVDADVDHSGSVSRAEFEDQLSHPRMNMYLRSIDLLPDQAEELFLLLDCDMSGEVDLSEFVHGCMRLRGNLKAIDFAVFVASFEENVKCHVAHMQ